MFPASAFAPRVFPGRAFTHALAPSLGLTTSPGGLFRRLGRTVYVLNSVNALRGVADLSGADCVSVGTGITNIAGQYAASNQSLIDGLYRVRDRARAGMSVLPGSLSGLATATVTAMVDDAFAVPSRTLSVCLPLVISQMTSSGNTVNANAVSVSVAAGANSGTAVCRASVVAPNGKAREYVLAEAISVTCVGDVQSSTASSGAEPWGVTGEAPASPLNWDWPAGSGVSTAVVTNTAATGLLTNGDFETWTVANTPDSWTISVGTVGTTILKEVSLVLRGSAALKIVGNGAQLTSLKQAVTLAPLTVYAVNAWLKTGSVPAAGVLQLDLYDGAAVLNDDAGTANAVTQSLPSLGTTYTTLGGFFRTPAVMPAAVYFRLSLTTALDNTVPLYLDELCLKEASELYTGGPYVAVFAGATDPVKADAFTITVSNDWGGKFQKAFERLFSMRSLGLQLPSDAAGGETIADSLVY